MLDLVRQEPGPSGALLQGLFFGRIAPHRNERRTFQTPTLVLGHHRDPVHPFSDAGMLAEELPNARLLEANSLVELRMQPERLTNEIAELPRRGVGEPARGAALQTLGRADAQTRQQSRQSASVVSESPAPSARPNARARRASAS